ncbi:MAG: saccharopine dehydrogenase [Bacteroidetes bacterium GWC2_33_15]|nr:MAG: saccharopine dehydrogenase [Bacteroidetes bacterium GWA2_33_15]OFX51510.1 MAG: saccharopine dehydrogenase [Bacteroidetes bacterium GWC2_33_15]OFX65743.1 MAG: saccharopine dehydrogenase [Bacteroidetes bacterium GWB2_32_14]OFX69146.1 MAG: saccharopine dehydrogenase [Bacteroidetes bacterium GWD2_33_33]
MKKIIILGAGMVGKAMAIDLSKKHEVMSTDIDVNSLNYLSENYNIKTQVLDVTNEKELSKAIKPFDIVVSAVPGFLGLQTMIQVIKNKKNLVDISFLPEDVLHLDQLAKENNVTVIMDCGVAPGMPNIIAGYHNEKMKIENFEYMVGGLPIVRTFPFEYKAPFSPCDVIEEYTRPARYVENSKMIVKPAMSDTEFIDFDNVGTLEAFNSDGLRSLIFTLSNIPNMKEKTLRYPGHINMIKALKAAGFLDYETIKVKGKEISPFDFTSEILFKIWKLEPEEQEFTIMRIILKGEENGLKKEIIYDLHDKYDAKEKLSSMARTTGFTATAAVNMVLNDVFAKKGVFPPELVGKYPECFTYMINYLKERNIHYKKMEKVL